MAGIAEADAIAATKILRFIFFPFECVPAAFPRGLNLRLRRGGFQFAKRELFRRNNRFGPEMRNKSQNWTYDGGR
jgi:hypothetical protein